MPIVIKHLRSLPLPPLPLPQGGVRKLVITDKDGIEHQINDVHEFQKIWEQMTPEQQRTWQQNYRFTPVKNLTGFRDYTGTARDLM